GGGARAAGRLRPRGGDRDAAGGDGLAGRPRSGGLVRHDPAHGAALRAALPPARGAAPRAARGGAGRAGPALPPPPPRQRPRPRRKPASIYASGAVGHTWASGLFPSGRGFHLLAYRQVPKGEAGWRYADYFDGQRYHEAEVLEFPHYSGVAGLDAYELALRV